MSLLEQLMEVYCSYSSIGPKAEGNRRAISTAFVPEMAPNIRKKLQRLEGFEGENLSKQTEIATKVYNQEDK